MMQQVNLFHPAFRRERKVFTAIAILQAYGLVVLGLGLIWGYSAWRTANIAAVNAQLQNQRQVAIQQLADMQKQYPVKQKSELLVRDLEQAKAELAARQVLTTALKQGVFGNTKGFSGYFEALAREHVEGLWLSKIDIEEGGRAMALAGGASLPELVPAYLARLGKEESFKGVTFSRFELQRSADAPLHVDFSLWTDEQERKAVAKK
jgi:hypothetical protein